MGNATASQELMATEGIKRVQLALRYRDNENDADIESAERQAFEHSRALVALGPPGCGTSYVLDYLIRRAQTLGARILACVPTGQLASELRSRHPNIEVDTCHGGLLLYKPLREVLPS